MGGFWFIWCKYFFSLIVTSFSEYLHNVGEYRRAGDGIY